MRNSYESPPPPYNAANHQGHTPAAYTESERHSLLYHYEEPSETKTSLTMSKLLCFLLLLAIILFSVSFVTLPTPEQTHEKFRREWEAEERAHQVMRDAWNSERQAIVVERGTWQKERADHILERESIAAEREQWRRERTDHENRKRQPEKDSEEGKRASIVWEDLKASTKCLLRYRTREYSATLAHVPLGMDPLKECWKKSIDIHGRQIFPSRCDTEGIRRTITGHWDVDFNELEASCVTWWKSYYNKRYGSFLEYLQWGDGWDVMWTRPGQEF